MVLLVLSILIAGYVLNGIFYCILNENFINSRLGRRVTLVLLLLPWMVIVGFVIYLCSFTIVCGAKLFYEEWNRRY